MVARHRRRHGRVEAQVEDALPRSGIIDRQLAAPRHHGRSVRLHAMGGAELLDGRQPGLLGELEQAARGRAGCLGGGISPLSSDADASMVSNCMPVSTLALRTAAITCEFPASDAELGETMRFGTRVLRFAGVANFRWLNSMRNAINVSSLATGGQSTANGLGE